MSFAKNGDVLPSSIASDSKNTTNNVNESINRSRTTEANP